MELEEGKSGVPTTHGENPPSSVKSKSNPHREAQHLRDDGLHGSVIPEASSMPMLTAFELQEPINHPHLLTLI